MESRVLLSAIEPIVADFGAAPETTSVASVEQYLTPEAAEATGVARVMVLRVYFDDYAATSRYTQAQVSGFFGEIDQLYRHTSYDNMSIDYQVSSLFELPDNRSAYIDDFATGDLSNGGKFDKVLLDAIANAPAGLDWTDLDSIMVLMAETSSSQFHRGQGTSARTLPQGPGGANKTVGAAIFSENPSDSNRAVWGRMAHEVGHAFQGDGPAHPSNYNSEFELMDSNYPGQIGVFEKQAGMGYPGWMPEYKYQEFDPIGGGGIANVYTMEYDPDTKPDVQAVRAMITDDLYYLVSVRRPILGDDLNASFTPNGIPDEGVLIERVVEGGDPWVTLQAPPGGTRNDLWQSGQTYTNLADGITIEVTRKSVPPDHYEIYVRYNPEVAHFPDVSMDPWTSPPAHTWETTDIWFDSPVNGYGSYRYGTWNDLAGNPVPKLNGDPPAIGLRNRVYARVRNVGTSTATDVKVRFEITDPMGLGIAGASGWASLGSTDKTAFPALAALAPGDYADVWIEWMPDIDVPAEDIVDGLFNYHTCVRVKIDPVAGETVLANQDGDREQENIGDFQVPEGGSGGAPFLQVIRLRNDDAKNDQYFYLNYDAASLPAGWKVIINDDKPGMLLRPGEVVDIPVLIDPGGPAPLGGVYGVNIMASRQVRYTNDLDPKDLHYHIEPLGGVTVTARVLRKTGSDAQAESHGPNEIQVWGKLNVEEFERFYDSKNPLRVMLVGLDANGKFIPGSVHVVPVRSDATFDGYLGAVEGGQPEAAMVLFAGTDMLATSAAGPLGLLGLDFGDAPEGALAPLYPTKMWANGARHDIVNGFHLGAGVDAEVDSQPNATATGDDMNPVGTPDDEDGVFFRSVLAPGSRARVDVAASLTGYLDAWIDFNADGDWADLGERVFTSFALAGGVNALSFIVPAAAKLGDTFARFRFSSTGGLSYVGGARDGEVEDYRVSIRPAILRDHFEPSDSLQTAIDIGYFGQSRTGLTLDDDDQDWFKWNALDSDDLTINLASEEQFGDLVLEVYDASGKLLASSAEPGNDQRVSLEVRAGENYYIHVSEAIGMAVADYRLEWLLAGRSKNYAVLFSGGANTANNHDRYYNNTKELYQILRDTYNIPQDRIYVLFADGTSAAVDRSSGVNSDMSYATQVYSATPANLESVLVDILTPLVDSNDHLFFWSFDHGGGAYDVPATTGEEYLNGWGSNVADEDLASWLDGVGAGYLTAVFTQCFAGGMLDNMTLSANEHGSAATNHYESSWGDGFAAAYNDGLVAHRNAHDVYWYAYQHDPYATDGEGPGGTVANSREHPWEASENNFRIFAQTTSLFPWLHGFFSVVADAMLSEMKIPYDELLAASNAGDPEGNAIQFRIETVDAGTLLKNGKPVTAGRTTIGFGEELLWIPDRAEQGGQSIQAFTVRAYNGAAVSDQRLPVVIEFRDPSQQLAFDDSLALSEDNPAVAVPVLKNDKGLIPMTVVGVGSALHGTAFLSDGVVFYQPDPEFSGPDRFTYYMLDASGQSDSAIVHVQVAPANDPPEAFDDEFTLAADAILAPIDVLMNDFDTESKPLTWPPGSGRYGIEAVILQNPMHGRISVDPNGVLLYTPDAGYEGEDAFVYRAFDGLAYSSAAWVTLHVISSRTKWYQPPVVSAQTGLIYGWDEPTRYGGQQIVADDWVCTTELPVTDIHWWGSFKGWTGERLPDKAPIGYQLGIWTDVPVSPNTTFSHPGVMIWYQYISDPAVEFAGHEQDPRDPLAQRESVFRLSVDLAREQWFWQDQQQGIYWLSIAAIYPIDYTIPNPFGWTTRPRDSQSAAPDAAVRIVNPTAPATGAPFMSGSPILWPQPVGAVGGTPWDMAFTLTTDPDLKRDFGDAPDKPYPTLLASNGAHHWQDSSTETPLRLGKRIDAEKDGQPNLASTGDDMVPLLFDDEDGVVFTTVIAAGRTAKVSVYASAPGYLNAWLDFGADGSWAQREDHIFANVPLVAGTNNLSFAVPFLAKLGDTYARFRLSTIGDLSYDGRALDGEVEDYAVRIRPMPKADHFEPSDSPRTAIDVGYFGQSRTSLNLDEGDEDWFKWNALDGDDLTINLSSEEQLGDLVLEVYDASGRLLASSAEPGNDQRVMLEVVAGQSYYIHVREAAGIVVSDYWLDWITAGRSQNYAVLFSGGGDAANNHNRYYNNTKELYEILRDTYHLPQDHIYVLFADGTNAAVDRSSGVNSDLSFALADHVFTATSANLEDVLVDTLTPLVDGNDHLFFWSFDHGGGAYNAPGTTGEEQLIGWGSNVNDEDLASWLDGVGAGYLTAVFTQCFAGGMLDNMTLSANEHGSAATNHYEFSWGDGFAAAYNDGLVAHRNAHDVYWYAYQHDPYATDGEGPGGTVADGREHPWEANENNFRIFAQKTTLFPFFELVRPLRYIPLPGPLPYRVIPYDELLAAAGVSDPEGGAIQFRIESVQYGRLLKDGKPIIPGMSTLGFGEMLMWEPGGPEQGAEVVDAFTVRAFNGAAISDRSMPVPINMAPAAGIAAGDELRLFEDGRPEIIPVLGNDGGVKPLSVIGVGSALHGVVTLVDGLVIYTPDPDFSGLDQFTYYMSDAQGVIDAAVVQITVMPVNDPPEAYPDAFFVRAGPSGGAVDLLGNDFDAESKPLSFTAKSGAYGIEALILTPPRHGQLTPLADGTFRYKPFSAAFVGEDRFTYAASDGQNVSPEAEVLIHVIPQDMVFTGSQDRDTWYVRLDSSREFIEFFENVPPGPVPTHAVPWAAVSSIAFEGLGGDDELKISFVNGSPIPESGFRFHGGAGLNDLILLDTSAADDLLVEPGLIFHNGGPIEYSGVLSPQLDAETGSVVRLASLDMLGGAVLRAGSLGNVLRTGRLNIGDGARLDMGVGDLVVQATALTRQAALADVLGWIASARNVTPLWSGPGIGSGGPLLSPNTGLACILNDNGAGAPLYSEFNGAMVDKNSILVKYTYNGDADANGMIDGRDYLKADYGYLAGLTGYAFGDCDYDGTRDGDDYFLMDAAFLSQTVVLAALASTPAAAIPAPAVTAWAARPADPPSPAAPVIGYASAWSRSASAIGESPLIPAALRETVRSLLASDDVLLGKRHDDRFV